MFSYLTKCSCLLLLLTGFAGCASYPAASADNELPAEGMPPSSQLWGRHGEQWLFGGRLPDFSFAGYHNGEQAIPDYEVTADVTKFGARGDDDVDDTAAFQTALTATKSGAIYVPPGRYVITGVLRITKNGVVLRGAGADKTTLYFPKPLNAIEPDEGATTSGQPTSNYSWSGGFVRLQGKFQSKVITAITAPASRGDRTITVENARSLVVGQAVEVFIADTAENTLAQHLYSDDAGDISNLKGTTKASLVSQITRIEGNVVHLERPLRNDLRAEWKPVVRAFEPTVQEAGVEDLTFEFPAIPYAGHFKEQGNNPVAFAEVANCWARRIKIVNPDSGPMVSGVFNTISDVVMESKRDPDSGGNQGHHGIYLNGNDNVFTRFDIRLMFIHDISMSHCSGVVVSQGRGVDLCFDQHKRAPYENLFTVIDLGRGTRAWKSGGGAALGKNAGARTTFWNIKASGPLPEIPKDYAPWSANFIGVDLGRPGTVDPAGLWQEFTAGEQVYPVNLHKTQLLRRLHDT